MAELPFLPNPSGDRTWDVCVYVSKAGYAELI